MKVVEKKARGGVIERAGETEGARRATGVFPAGAPAAGVAAGAERPEVEVVAKAERRRFAAEYKRRIVREADRCTKPGEIGALLRREGLYSSLLTTWRAAPKAGARNIRASSERETTSAIEEVESRQWTLQPPRGPQSIAFDMTGG